MANIYTDDEDLTQHYRVSSSLTAPIEVGDIGCVSAPVLRQPQCQFSINQYLYAITHELDISLTLPLLLHPAE